MNSDSKKKKKVIHVGTASPLKIEAVKKVFGRSFEIVGFNVKSGVPAQPKGVDQTKEGAINRCVAAKKEGNCDFSIGIENGMFEVDGYWVDAAAVVIMDSKGNEKIFWSDRLSICKRKNCQVCCDENGNVLIDPGPNGEWSILKDPHTELTKGEKSRAKFLIEALEKAKDFVV